MFFTRGLSFPVRDETEKAFPLISGERLYDTEDRPGDQSEAKMPCVRADCVSKTDSAVLPRNAPAAESSAKRADPSSP